MVAVGGTSVKVAAWCYVLVSSVELQLQRGVSGTVRHWRAIAGRGRCDWSVLLALSSCAEGVDGGRHSCTKRIRGHRFAQI